ncbi:MAG: right-handed parallel beta-helix repeat-containing protein [Thermomicrobiales bacterium]
MVIPSVETLLRRSGISLKRRSLFGLAASAPLGLLVTEPAAAKRRRGGGARAEKKKKHGKALTYCLNGQTVSSKNKKQQKTWAAEGATAGACTGGGGACTPDCSSGSCGVPDGCGGQCGCAAGSICRNHACQVCDVTCTGSAAQCGLALQAAINNGGEVHACPGRYAGPFTMTEGNNLFGAGGGTDPAVDTILDGQGTLSPVMSIPDGGSPLSLALQTLRITGGGREGILAQGRGKLILVGIVVAGNAGGGIRTTKELTMDYCEVSGNSISSATASSLGGRYGGGLFIEDIRGHHTIDHSQITGNSSDSTAGGIYVTDGDFEVARSAISGNTGVTVGGIHIGNSVTNTFVIKSSSVTNNVATSGAPVAGGIDCDANTCTIRNTTVSGNTTPQCDGLTCS